MNILITGAMGYIGSHVIIELLQANHHIIAVDICSNKQLLEKITEITNKTITFYQVDIRQADALNKIFSIHNIDCCIHLAALKAVRESLKIPLEYYNINVGGTGILLDVMKKNGCKNLIFLSSATIYGNAVQSPINEETPKGECTTPYAWTKRMCEKILTDLYLSDSSWNIVILRSFNPIGAHNSGKIGENINNGQNNLLPCIMQVALKKLPYLNVFGNNYNTPDGTPIRDYIHIMDLAQAHLKALKVIQEKLGLKIYNLGMGKGYSVLDVIKTFETETGKKIPYKLQPHSTEDNAVYYADISKIQQELGWSATHTLADMCKDAWNWKKNSARYKD